jgi:hypothetical protein
VGCAEYFIQKEIVSDPVEMSRAFPVDGIAIRSELPLNVLPAFAGSARNNARMKERCFIS